MNIDSLVPDGLVHVGWFCHHGPSTYNSTTRKWEREVPHREWRMKRDGGWKAKKAPNTIASVEAKSKYHDRGPACPLAQPMFVGETSDAAINFITDMGGAM